MHSNNFKLGAITAECYSLVTVRLCPENVLSYWKIVDGSVYFQYLINDTIFLEKFRNIWNSADSCCFFKTAFKQLLEFLTTQLEAWQQKFLFKTFPCVYRSVLETFNSFMTGSPNHIETSPVIWRVNQWTDYDRDFRHEKFKDIR